MDFILPKTRPNDVKELQDEFENDLIAYYKILEEEIYKLLDNPEIAAEDVITEIQKLFS